jgi:hypothetical protein
LPIWDDFSRFAFLLLPRVVIFSYTIVNRKHYPMKRMVQLYQQNAIVALIVNSIAFFVWAVTLIMIITIVAVAFTG